MRCTGVILALHAVAAELSTDCGVRPTCAHRNAAAGREMRGFRHFGAALRLTICAPAAISVTALREGLDRRFLNCRRGMSAMISGRCEPRATAAV